MHLLYLFLAMVRNIAVHVLLGRLTWPDTRLMNRSFLFLPALYMSCLFACCSLMAGTSWGQSNRRFNASADFIERIQPLSAILYQGLPDSSAINATCKAYWLFRDPSAGWMLIGNGSGQLWTLDSNLYWVRQDSTEAVSYTHLTLPTKA